ncbi:MAG: BON domain-containing protein [Spirulina sp. DLM2.Bin59]|nr:MAG: BON domain-containing protein [Spirulina sp. DLM2.Bin59]
MKQMIPFILGSFLLLGATACSENPENTAADGDGVRSDQLESDARAREQRDGTNFEGEQQITEDLAIDVWNSLENNLPGSRLAVDVDSENGKATIDGSVVTQDQLDKIEPLVMAFDGINSVDVKAKVNPN